MSPDRSSRPAPSPSAASESPAAEAPEAQPDLRRTVEERFRDRVEMTLPVRHNPRLAKILQRADADDELYAWWAAANVNAVERLSMTDHGPVHVKIVMNIAVRMLRLLLGRGVEPSIVRNYGMDSEDAEVVVALAALMHDVGMSVHRVDHEHYSLFLAESKLKELLLDLYEPRVATIVRSEVLHAIISHRAGSQPLTLEAGVVRIADALDMAKGRSRIPFESGSLSIHSVSAAAIDAVHIEEGERKPVRVRIEMSNSAGVFQLDELVRKKLAGSGLEPFIEIEAVVAGATEKRLVERFRL